MCYDITMKIDNLIVKTTKRKVNKFEFNDFLSRLKRFYFTHGRFPKQRETDIDGYTIGFKIDAIRQGIISLSTEQKQLLENFGLKTTHTKRKFAFNFEEFISRCLDFKQKYNRWPHSADISDDGYPIGKKIRYILINNVKLNAIQKELIKNLKIELLTYEEFILKDFCFRYKRAFNFLGRRPKTNELDPFDPDYKLGQYISRFLKKFNFLPENQQNILIDCGFCKYKEFALNDFCSRYKRAYQFLGRLPQANETDPFDANYKLGQKFQIYRKIFNKLTLEEQNKLLEVGFILTTL